MIRDSSCTTSCALTWFCLYLLRVLQYPMWLAAKESTLSAEEYRSRGLQYQCLQKIVNVYETTPDDFPRLMELMNDVRPRRTSARCGFERAVVNVAVHVGILCRWYCAVTRNRSTTGGDHQRISAGCGTTVLHRLGLHARVHRPTPSFSRARCVW